MQQSHKSPISFKGDVLPGFTLTVAAVALIELLSRLVYRLPSLTILLAVVAFVAFRSGVRVGLLSAAIVIVYGVYFLSPAHQIVPLGGGAALQLALLCFAALIIALLMGGLRYTQRAAERRLRASEAKLRLITAQLPAHLWTVDTNLCITSVMGTGLEHASVDPQLFVGKYLEGLVPENALGERIVVAHRQALRGQATSYERTLAGRAMSCRVESLRDERGAIIGCLGVAHDVSELTSARQRLALQYAVSRALAETSELEEAAPQIVQAIGEGLNWAYGVLWCLNAEGKELHCVATWCASDEASLASLDALTRTTVRTVGEGFTDTVWQQRAPIWVADIAQDAPSPRIQLAASAGLRTGLWLPVLHGDAVIGVIELLGWRERSPEPETLQTAIVLCGQLAQFMQRIDTERQLVGQRLEAARLAERDRLRREFVASVSHDLRTPLTAMRAAIGMVETSAATRLQADELRLLANARRNIARLDRQISDLLALNQIESGALALERERVDLRAVATDALATVEQLFAAKAQTVEIDLPQALPVDGDPWRIEQALVNLLRNAQQHTPPGTTITVAGQIIGDEAQLAIHDTGPGIPPESLVAVFQHYQRLGNDGEGFGLGLGIARGIVELHGGRIWLESQPGAGTSAHIALPTSRECGVVAPALPSVQPTA